MSSKQVNQSEFSAELAAARQRITELETAHAEQARLIEQLRITASKYSRLFDLIPIGVTLTDPDGRLIESNREAEHLLTLSPAEIAILPAGLSIPPSGARLVWL